MQHQALGWAFGRNLVEVNTRLLDLGDIAYSERVPKIVTGIVGEVPEVWNHRRRERQHVGTAISLLISQGVVQVPEPLGVGEGGCIFTGPVQIASRPSGFGMRSDFQS